MQFKTSSSVDTCFIRNIRLLAIKGTPLIHGTNSIDWIDACILAFASPPQDTYFFISSAQVRGTPAAYFMNARFYRDYGSDQTNHASIMPPSRFNYYTFSGAKVASTDVADTSRLQYKTSNVLGICEMRNAEILAIKGDPLIHETNSTGWIDACTLVVDIASDHTFFALSVAQITSTHPSLHQMGARMYKGAYKGKSRGETVSNPWVSAMDRVILAGTKRETLNHLPTEERTTLPGVILTDTKGGSLNELQIQQTSWSYFPFMGATAAKQVAGTVDTLRVQYKTAHSSMAVEMRNARILVLIAPDSTPLAIELVSFDATAGYESVELMWMTGAEIDTREWVIARSMDSLNFSVISDKIRAQGSNSRYNYIDSLVEGGIQYWYKLGDININGDTTWNGPITSTPRKYTTIKFVLHQPFPNPFMGGRGKATIRYNVPGRMGKDVAHVLLVVYDVLGRRVKTLVDKAQKSGSYTLNFDNKGMAAGVYFLMLRAKDEMATRKFIML